MESTRSICNEEVESVFQNFLDFLVSPDLGKRALRSAKACVQRVIKILNAISPNQEIQKLCEKKLLLDSFLNKYTAEEKYHPGMIQTFLRSLGHFYNFVLSEEVPQFNKLKDKVVQMNSKLNMWKTSYHKDHQIAIMRKLEKDRRNKITPDDIIEFENSKIFRQAVTEIRTYDGLQNCSQKSFVVVSNLVMTEILIDKGQRAGVLANMTMEEFESTEKIVDDDGITTYCLTVMHHKEERAGPIRVMMSPKLYSWLDVYVKNYRKWATKDRGPKSRVFVTWRGEYFHYSGDVSTQINSLWHQAGMKKQCGANMFRKAAVSATRESADDNANEDLANLMGTKKIQQRNITTCRTSLTLQEEQVNCCLQQ